MFSSVGGVDGGSFGGARMTSHEQKVLRSATLASTPLPVGQGLASAQAFCPTQLTDERPLNAA
ncbi:hypothetical protein LUTEI9C_110007 [Luteimonas sp. 9C]|nr:hypothetical protein LUTEI9C_110007 [Luteimonas sp. 9C]